MNWEAAAGVAEMVPGALWQDLARDTYVQACGLSAFGYAQPGPDLAVQTYPPGIDGLEENIVATLVTDHPSPGSGVYADLDGYAKTLSICLNGGICGWGDSAVPVLTEAAVATTLEDHIAATYGGSASHRGFILVPYEGYGMGWWLDRDHPGVAMDVGAWGAIPWIDLERGYAAFIALETSYGDGYGLILSTRPLLEAAYDALQP